MPKPENNLTLLFKQQFRIIIYPLLVILFGLIVVNSIFRNYEFSYDSINYLQVASNIASGKGITGSAINFNQSLNLDDDPAIPSPYIAQPAVYPILLAAGIRAGITPLNTARVLSILSLLAIIAGLFGFVWLVGRRSSAWLPLLFLAWFAPFREIIAYAWTEPLALALLIWSLLCYLIYDRHPHWLLLLLSGLCAGLAAGTRFVIGLLFVVYLVDLLVKHLPMRKLISRAVPIFSTGALTILPTLYYNWLSSGRLLPQQLPTEKTFWVNLADAFTAIFKNVFYTHNTLLSVGLVLVLLIGWVLIHRSAQGKQPSNPNLTRIFRLLVYWSVCYLVVLLIQRSITFFSPLNSRILVMITLWMMFRVSILLAILYRHHLVWLNGLGLVLALTAIGSEIHTLRTIPTNDAMIELASSPRIRWLQKHTKPDDLIIGDNTPDVSLLLGNHSISFSTEPYTYVLEYEPLVGYLNRHCDEYPRVWMAIQEKVHQGTDFDLKYGPFIADLAAGQTEAYPEFERVASPDELTIYRVQCTKP